MILVVDNVEKGKAVSKSWMKEFELQKRLIFYMTKPKGRVNSRGYKIVVGKCLIVNKLFSECAVLSF